MAIDGDDPGEAFSDPITKPRGRQKGSKNKPKDPQAPKPDTPPTRPATPPANKGWTRAVEIENILFNYLEYAALGVSFLNEDDAQSIRNGAARLAHELVELAKVDNKFKKLLETIASPGKYGGLLLATGSIILPIAMNHNLIPQFIIPLPAESELKEGE